jgi:hypothetical protein
MTYGRLEEGQNFLVLHKLIGDNFRFPASKYGNWAVWPSDLGELNHPLLRM